MAIPFTKVYLSTAVSNALSGYRFLPQAAGDFYPTVSTQPAATWAAGIADLNGDLIPDIIIGAPGDDDKTTDAGRIFIELSQASGTLASGTATTEIIIDGVNAGDLAGAAIGSIKDLNNDGKAEILIGAPGIDNGALLDAGAGFVIWGMASGSVDLGNPSAGDGKGYIINGEAAGDKAGQTLTSITDLNGDGKSEVLIGASGSDAAGVDAGAAYVVWGKSTSAIVNLTNVTAGTGGYRIVGQTAGDAAGQALASLADQNGDGKAEILVGAAGNDAGGLNAGAVYVVFGQSVGTQVNLNDIAAGIGGYRITGVAGTAAGSAVTALGDINGDGLSDILVGASAAGKAYVVLGKSDTSEVLLSNVAAGIGGFVITPELGSDLARLSVAGGADFNRDGINDIVIGTPTNSEGGANAGAVYIVWGGDTRAINLATVSQGIGGAKIVGSAGSLTGSSVSVLSDMNGDGTADLLIGSPGSVGESVSVVYAPTSWQADNNIYGSNGNDVMDVGYGGLHKIGSGDDAILGLNGNDTIHGGDGSDNIDGGAGNDILYGDAGNDTLDGGVGIDTLVGGLGDDTYKVDNVSDVIQEAAGEGIDTVIASVNAYTLGANVENLQLSIVSSVGTGNDVDNTITGTAGNDTLNGGLGADTLIGGLGNDAYVVDNIGDVIQEALNAGTDSVSSSIDWTLGANLENLTLTGTARVGSGNALVNIITGTAGNDFLDGGLSLDTLIGGLGDDTYYVDNSAEVVTEAAAAGNDTVVASVGYTLGNNVENLQLTGTAVSGAGNALNNTLIGNAANNSLNGAAGADTMIGGLGDDSYYVDNLGDVVQENVGEGADSVVTSIENYTLGANVENLQLSGSVLVGTGNSLNNMIAGNGSNNTLDGGAGADTLIGGIGNDTYLIDNLGDVIQETTGFGSGTDSALVSIDGYTLATNVENLQLVGSAHIGSGNDQDNSLIGGAGDDQLYAAGGNDSLNGGLGSDAMVGGLGNDSYYIDNIGDTVQELAAEGTDTAYVSVDNWQAGENVENIILTGSAHSVRGNDQDNVITGGSGNDTLDGAAGNDSLNGGLGADLMIGGLGDDTYTVDDLGDVVQEGANAGTDTVITSIDNYTLTLSASIENLTLSGSALSGTGNEFSNTITGNAGNNILDGGAGADILIGGLGDDTYWVDNTADVVQEAVGAGTDTVIASVDYTLSADVDNLQLTGTATVGTGNSLDNKLTGTTADDTLYGLAGNDILDGGLGNDVLVGGDGDDTYYIDNINDVVVEAANGGIDRVYTNIDNWMPSDNIENISLTGSARSVHGNALNNSLTGTVGDDTIDGGDGDDLEAGGDGNDVLISGAGIDTLAGGSGDDRYVLKGGQASIEDFLGHDTVDASEATGDSSIDLTTGVFQVGGQSSHVGTAGTTSSPLDVQFLQDLTGSFADDIITVRSLVPQIVSALQAAQANSEFGVSTFRDKAIGAFGGAGDWVYQMPLALTTSANTLTNAYASMVAYNGADAPEAQIEALMQLALHSADVGFRPDSAHFVVLFTDATFHTAGEGIQAGITTANNGDAIMDAGPSGVAGTGEDYPMIQQVQSALAAANIIPIFAVAGGLEATYQGLVGSLGRGTVVTLTANSSNVVSAITGGLTAATTTYIEDANGGVGNDTLTGNIFSNALNGNDGNDRLSGDAGNDTLKGGTGNDILSGGTGSDTFVFSHGDGQDEIGDDSVGNTATDVVQFSNVASTDVLLVSQIVNTTNLLLVYGAGDQIIVDGYFGANTAGSITQFQFSDGVIWSQADVQLHLLGGNDAPALTGSPAVLVNGSEDVSQIISAADLLQGYTDANGDVLSVANLSADHGSFVDNGDATWTFTPAANYNGTVNLHYQVVDGKGGISVANQSFSLASVNDAPILTGPAATLAVAAENASYTISATDLLTGFSDVDGDVLSVSSLTADSGSLVDNLDGTWTLTPATNYVGAVSLSYNVVDGNGGIAAASQSFNLAAVNYAPVLTGTAATLVDGSEDVAYTISAIDLLAGFSDANGDALAVASLVANNGSLTDNLDGTWSFVPDANYNGSVSLSYDVIDGNGGVTAASQSFTLAAVNDAPLLTGVIATLVDGSEDVAYTINAIDLLAGYSDVDGDTLAVTNLLATNGTLTDNLDGTWSFVPAANYNGPVSLSYDVIDGNGGITAASQSFTLAAVNDAPLLTGVTATLVDGSEDVAYTINAIDLLAGYSDVDGDTLAVTNLLATNGILTDNLDGTWSFVPAVNYNGSVALNYDVIDGNGGITAASQSFTLAAVNDAPLLTGVTATLVDGSEDVAYTISAIDLLAGYSDVDGDALAVTNLLATNGTLTDNLDGTWSFVPAANYNGSVALSYDVIDGNGGVTAASQSFTLAAVNDAPLLAGVAATLVDGSENTSYTISAADLLAGFSDVDGDVLSVSSLTADSGSLVDNLDGTWTLTPATNYVGAVNLSYNVVDGNGGIAAASQSFNLAAVNYAPVLTGLAATLVDGSEDVAYTISAIDLLAGFSDANGDALAVASLVANNGSLTDNLDGTWSFVPDANYNGSVSLSYDVIDGNGGVTAASQSFTLAAVNDAPLLTGVTATLVDGSEDVAYTISAIDLLAGYSDVDGDALAVTNLLATNGILTDNLDGTWSFVPAVNYNGSVALNYDVIDGNGGVTAASQSFNLLAVNDAAVLTGSAAILADGSEDSIVTLFASDLLAGFSDVEGNALAVSGLAATNGVLTDNGNGSWSFTPAANYNGIVNLSYNVIDGQGGITAANQSFNLVAVNDAPVLTGAAAVLTDGTEGSAYTLSASDLLVGFSDVDGDALSVAGLVADNGTLTDNADGTWTFVPTANYYGPVHLSYNVIDGNGAVTPAAQAFTLQSLTVNVAAVIDTTTVNASTVSATAISYSGSLAFSDANIGDTHSSTPAVAVGAAGGSFTSSLTEAAGSGRVDWNYSYLLPTTFGKTVVSKTDSFDVAIDDGHGGVVSQNIAVNITTGTSAIDTLTGTAGIDILLGAGGNDSLNGGAGNDTLDGGAGTDTLSGGLGDDRYVVDNVGDVLIESAGEGVDSVNSKVTYTLAANVENLTLTGTGTINATGNADANVIIGGIGKNILDGLAGADTLIGGLGNDTYVVDDAGDVVIEDAAAGTDVIQSSISFDLSKTANIENLTLLGAANVDGMGDAGANTITGNTGNNILVGGAGVDKLIGGGGNDTYVVNITATGTLEDSITANTGIDTIQVQGGYSGVVKTLTAATAVENYDISGTGSSLLNLTGNASNNILTGNDANNLINGGAGADVLAGGLGDDTYTVDNIADSIIENAAAGVDLVNSAVSFDLSTNGLNVEKLTLSGTAATNATGNNGDNLITGNSAINILLGNDGNDSLYGLAGNDVLDGGNGNDLLIGGAGNDTLTGGAGADAFWSNTALSATTNLDTITDFTTGVDSLQFSVSVLTKLGAVGQFAADDVRFWSSATGAAHDADDRLIYNTTTGELSYDSNGIATGGAVVIEVLGATTALAASDIWVV